MADELPPCAVGGDVSDEVVERSCPAGYYLNSEK